MPRKQKIRKKSEKEKVFGSKAVQRKKAIKEADKKMAEELRRKWRSSLY